MTGGENGRMLDNQGFLRIPRCGSRLYGSATGKDSNVGVYMS